MGNYETQLYSVDDTVAKITFNRPERRNATDVNFYRDLLACFAEAEEDPKVRSVVLAGAGPVFCAGQDLKWSAQCSEAEFDEYNRLIDIAWEKIRRLSKPVIARVHGDALGGGMYMSTRCDLIAIKATARMAMREIVTGEQSGGTHLLTVGKQRAMEINLLGRYVTGVEAERWDLANAVVDTDEELDATVKAWTDQIATLPPLAVKTTKDTSNLLLDLAGFASHWKAQMAFTAVLDKTEDRLEAKRAWVEKRAPHYLGR